MAPLFNGIIDSFAHSDAEGGVRLVAAQKLADVVGPRAHSVDFCCGVGASTRALHRVMPGGSVVGIDTSGDMLRVAQNYEQLRTTFFDLDELGGSPAVSYLQQNAETTDLKSSFFDLATVFYGFHEVPYAGRAKMMAEAARVVRPDGVFAIIDVAPTFEPSISMLAGEPYILEYKANIITQVADHPSFDPLDSFELVRGQVYMWILRRRQVDRVVAPDDETTGIVANVPVRV
jgi:ubiquinone/menaquinone biosynthesis C-methylase UbiE